MSTGLFGAAAPADPPSTPELIVDRPRLGACDLMEPVVNSLRIGILEGFSSRRFAAGASFAED